MQIIETTNLKETEMKTEIKTPNFMDSAAKIIAEIRTKTCIDAFDAEVIEKMLQDALNEYYEELNEYYEEEYYNAISSARNSAYDSGYDDGYSDGHSESHSAV